MKDDDFKKLLHDYLQPPSDPNPEMAGIEFVWIRDSDDFGALHMRTKHGVAEKEVEEVLLEVPPYVQAKTLAEEPYRTAFWGATRLDRWLVVICEDWSENGTRYLKPITAFEPDDGEDYWGRL